MKRIILVSLIFCCFTSAAWPFTAVSDKARNQSKTVKTEKTAFGVLFENDIIDYENIPSPSRQGIFILRRQTDKFDEKPRLSWFAHSENSPLLATDEAVAVHETVKFPSQGKLVFSRTVRSSDGAHSVIEWQYKVLADDYARITRRVNSGAGINIYDGPPLEEAGLTSVFLLKPLVTDASPETVLTLDSASGGSVNTSELLAFNRASVNDDAFGDSEILPGEPTELLDLSKSSISQPISSVLWRMTILSPETDSVHSVETGVSKSGSKIYWNGMIYGGKAPCADGEYRMRFDIFADTPSGQIRFSTCEKKMTVAKTDRLTVFSGSGEMIADSRFNGVILPKESGRMRLCKPYRYVPYPKAYYYGTNRIHMKKNSEDDTFTIKLYAPSEGKAIQVYVSSENRNSVAVPLKSSGDGEYAGTILVTSQSQAPPGSLVTGNTARKSFAFLDTSYAEDSQAFENALRSKGWISRGSIYPDELNLPEKGAFLTDFIRSGGYETIKFSWNNGTKTIVSKLLIKNQANIFYYSGHGWGDGSIHSGAAHFNPGENMEAGDWNDGMSIAIFSSCSVLDIMNVKNRSFTHIGNFTLSPGALWAKAAGPEVLLLGYNWSTFEGKPPNAFDTRVIRSFLSRMGSEANIQAWMNANISNNEAMSPCAVFQDTYYYLDERGRLTALPRNRWSNEEF